MTVSKTQVLWENKGQLAKKLYFSMEKEKSDKSGAVMFQSCFQGDC